MGLDLVHYKAVTTPDEEFISFPPEEFPPEAFGVYAFDRWVQDLPVPQIVHSAYFYRDETAARCDAKMRALYSEPNGMSCWIGTPDEHESALREFEQLRGLDRSKADLSEEPVRHSEMLYRRTRLSYWGARVERGVFVVEVGYQRKGMDSSFYNHFGGRGQIFVAEEDFSVLENFLCPEIRDELLPNLRENFIDNYERGKSLLWVSG